MDEGCELNNCIPWIKQDKDFGCKELQIKGRLRNERNNAVWEQDQLLIICSHLDLERISEMQPWCW